MSKWCLFDDAIFHVSLHILQAATLCLFSSSISVSNKPILMGLALFGCWDQINDDKRFVGIIVIAPIPGGRHYSLLSLRPLQIYTDVEIHGQFSITCLSDAGDSSARCGCCGQGEASEQEKKWKGRKDGG